jgi:DnaJ like chaperone protein
MPKHSFQSLIQLVTGAAQPEDGVHAQRTRERNKEIKNAMLVLAAAVIRCDKNFTSSTEVYIEQYLQKQMDASSTTIGKVVAGHVDTGTEPFTKMACSVLKMLVTYDSTLSILRFLFGVAAADDFVNPKEIRCIQRIAKYLAVSDADFKTIKEEFLSVSNPYAVLGLQEGASAAEVKSAYRKLTLQYHPDKQKDEKQSAEAKQRYATVRRAYDAIQERSKE